MKNFYYLISSSYFMTRFTSQCDMNRNKFKDLVLALALQGKVTANTGRISHIKEIPTSLQPYRIPVCSEVC